MSAKWQRVEVIIPKDLSPSDAEELADLYIAEIKNRTVDRNISKDGKRFPKYSKSYIESVAFKDAGKSASVVDLTLSGDMLDSLKLLKKDKGKLVIGFERGSVENGKADGNIRGTYGKAEEDPKKKRDFLGLPDKELRRLIETFDSKEFENVGRTRFKTVYK